MARLADWCAAPVLIVLLACTDDGVIGKNGGAAGDGGASEPSACTPACELDEICDAESGRCLECTGAVDCEVPDECDDCRVGDADCMAMFCRPCTTDGDCSTDEPVCAQGRCTEGLDP